MASNNTVLKGNGHINVSNVNAVDSECITLTYTMRNFKSQKQVQDVRNSIYDLIKDPIIFDLEVKNWNEENEQLILKAKVKSCGNERKAHNIKKLIDEYISKKGGQTTLDQGDS